MQDKSISASASVETAEVSMPRQRSNGYQPVIITDMEDSKQQIQQLADAAKEAIDTFGDNQNHTVAAAVLSDSGKIYTGLNLFHFTGGPCAEIATVAAAISNGSKQLVTVVAVGNNNRGVLAPCGRCRQVLFDYYPNINVVISDNQGLTLKPISDLLPETYNWNKQQETV